MKQIKIVFKVLFFLSTLAMSTNAFAAYKLLELYVSSNGNDNAQGTINSPIASLMKAQEKAATYLATLDLNGIHKNDYIKVRINLEGSFTCQTFEWKYPYKNVHLHIRSTTQTKAILNGHRQGCYNSGENGLTFFGAYGEKSMFNNEEFKGFGSISIHSLEIKHYGTAINISAHEDKKPGLVSVKHNVFYNIGQIVDPVNWLPRYSVIELKHVDGAEIIDNSFIKIGNTYDTSLMHAIYFKRSDRSKVENNLFESISGPPLKFRNSSDKHTVINNTFKKGANSTHNFPAQNWYSNWWLSDEDAGPDRELPSFDNYFHGNSYLNGYLDYPISYVEEEKRSICVNRIVATPNVIPQSYNDAAAAQGTTRRFNMSGVSVYGTHWSNLNCNQYNAEYPSPDLL